MTPLKWILERFKKETEPENVRIEKVRAQVINDELFAKAILKHLPKPDYSASTRIRLKVLQKSNKAVSIKRPLILVSGVATAFVVGLILIKSDKTIEIKLEPSQENWQQVVLNQDLAFSFNGKGEILGKQDSPVVKWDSGTVKIEVEPDKGIQLSVQTSEATVKVVGTGFSVTRNSLGTNVDVDHGTVSVKCVGSSENYALNAGEHHLCLPTTAAGMLARARTLQDNNASSAEIISTADKALNLPSSPVVRGELMMVKIQALKDNNPNLALEFAQEYLNQPDALRKVEVSNIAARLALSSEGCSTAIPFLEQLAQIDPSTPGLIHLADCYLSMGNFQVEPLLEKAILLSKTPEERVAAQSRLASLTSSN